MQSMPPKNEFGETVNVAGVILAAGASKRFGQPKQLLSFCGKTFIENVIETALSAALFPVIVVLGANASEIKQKLVQYQGLIEIVVNSEWKVGQSSSIRVAINKIEDQAQAAIFFLVDQPQIRTNLVLALVGSYLQKREPIIAPFVGEKRGNPVLFDQSVFEKLNLLSSDQGGRILFNEIPPARMEWTDTSLFFDVDSPEDYQKLKAIYEQTTDGA